MHLFAEANPHFLFTENETNCERLFGAPNSSPYVKDASHQYVIHGHTDAVNPAHTGTKSATYYKLEVPAAGEVTARLRLASSTPRYPFDADFDRTLAAAQTRSGRVPCEAYPERTHRHRTRLDAPGIRRTVDVQAVLSLLG